MAHDTNDGALPLVILAFADAQGTSKKKEALRLHEEQRAIEAALERGDLLEAYPMQYTTVEDIRRFFHRRRFRDRIAIFHFGGHASGTVLELEQEYGRKGTNKDANARSLAEFLGLWPSLKLVFLNGCSTSGQIDALKRAGIKAVIATTEKINDDEALRFSEAFYQGLGAGTGLKTAFDAASIDLRNYQEDRDEAPSVRRESMGASEPATGHEHQRPWVLSYDPTYESWVPQLVDNEVDWFQSLHDLLTDELAPWEFRDIVERHEPNVVLGTTSLAPSIHEDLQTLVLDNALTTSFFDALADELPHRSQELARLGWLASPPPLKETRQEVYADDIESSATDPEQTSPPPPSSPPPSSSPTPSSPPPSSSPQPATPRPHRSAMRSATTEEGEIHALLVGIDHYPGPGFTTLAGCVNDVDDVQSILLEDLGVDASRVIRLVSPVPGYEDDGPVVSHPASRAEIVRAFETLCAREINATDRVFVHFSCHGTRLDVRAPNGSITWREALVPADADFVDEHTPKNLLFDVELVELFKPLLERTKRISVVLDCCMSAGLTRSRLQTRRVPITGPVDAAALGLDGMTARMGSSDFPRTLRVSISECVVAAACLEDEGASEILVDGKARGAFTSELTRQLRSVDRNELGGLRWSRIWPFLHRGLQSKGISQTPRLLGEHARMVFGSRPLRVDPGFGVHASSGQFELDAGTFVGVSPHAIVAVYGPTPMLLPADLESKEEQRVRLGLLEVTSATEASARARLARGTKPFELPVGARGRVIQAGDDAATVVAIEPPNDDLKGIVESSGLVRPPREGEESQATLRRIGDELRLVDDLRHKDDPLATLPRSSPPARIRMVLEHYHRYIRPVRMARSCPSASMGTLMLDLLDCSGRVGPDGHTVDVDPYAPDLPPIAEGADRVIQLVDGQARYCFRLRSSGHEILFVTIFECGSRGAVNVLGGREVVVPPSGQMIVWWDSQPGEPFVPRVPDGRDMAIDRIVAIGTTDRSVSLDYLRLPQTFEDILRPSQSPRRDLTGDDASPPRQWTAAIRQLRVVRASSGGSRPLGE